jgi:hypothetical protein
MTTNWHCPSHVNGKWVIEVGRGFDKYGKSYEPHVMENELYLDLEVALRRAAILNREYGFKVTDQNEEVKP